MCTDLNEYIIYYNLIQLNPLLDLVTKSQPTRSPTTRTRPTGASAAKTNGQRKWRDQGNLRNWQDQGYLREWRDQGNLRKWRDQVNQRKWQGQGNLR